MKNQIIILCGFSSSGKDTIAKIFETQHDYNFVVSTTTRPIRNGESDRNPYNFTNNDGFEKLISNNELIEYREYHTLVQNKPETWYYGVEKSEILPDKKYVVVLDIVGLLGFKEHFKDRVVSFFIDVDDQVRKHRCISRGDFDEFEWDRRLLDDKEKFTKEVINKEIDYVINGYDTTINIVETIIKTINRK